MCVLKLKAAEPACVQVSGLETWHDTLVGTTLPARSDQKLWQGGQCPVLLRFSWNHGGSEQLALSDPPPSKHLLIFCRLLLRCRYQREHAHNDETLLESDREHQCTQLLRIRKVMKSEQRQEICGSA